MSEENYKMIGQFIYGAHRHGGNAMDIANWMADDLGVARPSSEDDALHPLYAAFFAKYNDNQLQDNLARFLEHVKTRPA